MTPTDLVEIVAEVLDTHVRIKSQTLHQECLCGWVGGLLGYDHCAHQAAAVLAALTEAGTVEWGVENDDGPATTHVCHSESGARWMAAEYGGTLVSRLALPWTAAEE